MSGMGGMNGMNGAFWSAGACLLAATVVEHRRAIIPAEATP